MTVKDDAVSPVVGVILMVALTLVMVGVLWVSWTGFAQPSSVQDWDQNHTTSQDPNGDNLTSLYCLKTDDPEVWVCRRNPWELEDTTGTLSYEVAWTGDTTMVKDEGSLQALTK